MRDLLRKKVTAVMWLDMKSIYRDTMSGDIRDSMRTETKYLGADIYKEDKKHDRKNLSILLMERCSGGPSEKLITGGRGNVRPWIAVLVPVSYAGQCEGGPSEKASLQEGGGV